MVNIIINLVIVCLFRNYYIIWKYILYIVLLYILENNNIIVTFYKFLNSLCVFFILRFSFFISRLEINEYSI